MLSVKQKTRQIRGDRGSDKRDHSLKRPPKNKVHVLKEIRVLFSMSHRQKHERARAMWHVLGRNGLQSTCIWLHVLLVGTDDANAGAVNGRQITCSSHPYPVINTNSNKRTCSSYQCYICIRAGVIRGVESIRVFGHYVYQIVCYPDKSRSAVMWFVVLFWQSFVSLITFYRHLNMAKASWSAGYHEPIFKNKYFLLSIVCPGVKSFSLDRMLHKTEQ